MRGYGLMEWTEDYSGDQCYGFTLKNDEEDSLAYILIDPQIDEETGKPEIKYEVTFENKSGKDHFTDLAEAIKFAEEGVS